MISEKYLYCLVFNILPMNAPQTSLEYINFDCAWVIIVGLDVYEIVWPVEILRQRDY